MENNSKFEKFVSILASYVNDNENDAKKCENDFFGKIGIAVMKFIGLLTAILIIMVGLRFVVHPEYWHLVDLFSTVSLVTLSYFIVISKIFKKE